MWSGTNNLFRHQTLTRWGVPQGEYDAFIAQNRVPEYNRVAQVLEELP